MIPTIITISVVGIATIGGLGAFLHVRSKDPFTSLNSFFNKTSKEVTRLLKETQKFNKTARNRVNSMKKFNSSVSQTLGDMTKDVFDMGMSWFDTVDQTIGMFTSTTPRNNDNKKNNSR